MPISGIISCDGKSMGTQVGGAWTFQFKNIQQQSISRLERINLIESLETEIEILEKELINKQEELSGKEIRLEECRSSIEELQSEVSEKKGFVTELRATSEALEKNYEIHQSKIEKLIIKRNAFSEEKVPTN